MIRCDTVRVLFAVVGMLLIANLWRELRHQQKPSRLCAAEGFPDDGDRSEQSWSPPVVPNHLQDADQTDPDLIEHIRRHWIIPPSVGRLHLDRVKYHNRKRDDFSEQGQVEVVVEVLDGRRGGFFVECGAADGQRNSNSLYLELFLNWTGLLIEADPTSFAELRLRHRHAHLLNACLSPTARPMVIDFMAAGFSGGINDFIPVAQRHAKNMDGKTPIRVQCFPMYSVLAAVGVSHVDYFSLDIEGAELEVLETIPYGDVTFDVITVETRVLGDEGATVRKRQAVEALLEPRGYRTHGRLKFDILLTRS